MIKYIAGYLFVSLALGLIWAVSMPAMPSTLAQWCWIFALALPLQLAGEYVGQGLWNNRVMRSLELKTAATSFSLLRIGAGLVVILAVVGLLSGIVYAWGLL